MSIDPFVIPGAAWTHPFDTPLDQVKGPSRSFSAGMLLKMAPMILRLMNYTRQRKANGFDPMNTGLAEAAEPYQGVPLGGLGSGSIGRGWRGDFRRWTLRPGFISNQPVWANQFSVWAQRAGDLSNQGQARVLFPGRPTDGTLSAWKWDLPAAGCAYHALFPRAWTTYEEPLPGIRLACRQLSPVIAHNYRESSLPVSEFRWKIENTGEDDATVALMFTFQNGMGQPNDAAGGHINRIFSTDEESWQRTRGVMLHHHYRQQEISEDKRLAERETYEDPLTFAIAGRIPIDEFGSPVDQLWAQVDDQVTYRARFLASGDGEDLWRDFEYDGRLNNLPDEQPAAPGETIGAAVAITVRVAAGESREVAFSLAWDMPVIRVGCGRPYYRRYSFFYGIVGNSAANMACDALALADQWEEMIHSWQAPLLENRDLPDWYCRALFNELYYLVDGGTIWAYPAEEDIPDIEMGHFGYLEGHEYRMYNTYDVHFYSSWALAQLWPRLELALQRDIAAATLAETDEVFTELYSGKKARRKLHGAVPHDVGWPDEDPWVRLNGYFLHDVNHWKDLNAKFVLQVYRDYVLTGDREFVQDTWEAVESAVRRLNRFDRDGDGMIENDNFPDQTYDMWPARGPSAYSGGLWLACLAAAARLAEVTGEHALAEEYARMQQKASAAYESRLWNGQYYRYDSSRSRHANSIMADQMAGQWYARACGLPPIVDPQRARSALETVFEFNVRRFQQGRMGAVNGMRPDGTVDTSCMQSQEVWSGTTYAIAAAMIQEGLVESGFATAEGIYKMTYEQNGYWFQTPEAWDASGNYRSIAYMRPLAVWAMQWALERGWEQGADTALGADAAGAGADAQHTPQADGDLTPAGPAEPQ